MGNTILRVDSINKIFQINKKETFQALKDINFTVNEGDFLSIMGPSGCGKSTLLYLLGGLDDPSSGSVYFNEKDLKAMSSKERSKLKCNNMGFIFQFYNLVPNLTVEDNIMLPIILDGKDTRKHRAKLDEILSIIDMGDKRKELPRNLSGGQQQRVAIARALVFEPELILADEPIGNLDSKNGTIVMELLQKINRDLGTTIIQVTHSEEAAAYGTHIVNMKDGEIVAKESLVTV